MTLRNLFLSAVLTVGGSSIVRAEPIDYSETESGWSPAHATAWMAAQMEYSKAVRQYGEGSPEATQAQVMMNTLARKLKIQPPKETPGVAALEPQPERPEDNPDSSPVALPNVVPEAASNEVPDPALEVTPEGALGLSETAPVDPS